MISDLHHPRHVPGCVASTLARPLFLGLRELSKAVTARVARPQRPVIHHPKVAALPSRAPPQPSCKTAQPPTRPPPSGGRLHLALCAGQDSVPGLPLMVLGGLLHRSRSWRGAVLTLHSLVGLLYRAVVASHLPLASGSPRHQSTPSERQSLSWGGSLRPYNHTHKKPGLMYCGGVRRVNAP